MGVSEWDFQEVFRIQHANEYEDLQQIVFTKQCL